MPKHNTKTARQLHEQSKRSQRVNQYIQERDRLMMQLKKIGISIKRAEKNNDDTNLTELLTTERTLTGKLHFYLNKIDRNQ